MDWETLAGGFIVGLVAVLIAVGSVVLYLAVILLCGWAVEWVLNWLNIAIDGTLYWTGVALLVLFCAFGKTKVEKEKD